MHFSTSVVPCLALAAHLCKMPTPPSVSVPKDGKVEEADLEAFAATYRGTLAVTTLEDSLSLYAAEWQSPLAWVFGAEGQGVRRALLDRAGLKIRIPMPGAVESLNVGAAAAVCLFEAVRRRLG